MSSLHSECQCCASWGNCGVNNNMLLHHSEGAFHSGNVSKAQRRPPFKGLYSCNVVINIRAVL